MSEQNIVLVTGMSGAGKSTAMSILEDMGYHCIDQFPVQLVSSLGKIIKNDPDPRYQNIALATSALDYPTFLTYFENINVNVRVVFLDASNEKLLRRAESIVCSCTDAAPEEARAALEQSGYSCKLAIVMLLLEQSKKDAEALLARADGRISAAIALARKA